jgi:hypothetical protein
MDVTSMVQGLGGWPLFNIGWSKTTCSPQELELVFSKLGLMFRHNGCEDSQGTGSGGVSTVDKPGAKKDGELGCPAGSDSRMR